jgi:Rieske Fe-S protein
MAINPLGCSGSSGRNHTDLSAYLSDTDMGDERVSRELFIRTAVALGIGVAGGSVLAGCGNKTNAGRAITGGQEVTSGPQVAPGEAIAAASDLQTNSAVSYTNAETGQAEVLVRLPDEEFVAYSAVCTHQGCTVAYQRQTQRLACPCHGGVFDPAKGAEVVTGPPPRPLPEVEIEVRDGRVFRA